MTNDRDLAEKLSGGTLSIRSELGIGSGVRVRNLVLTAAHVVVPKDKSAWSPKEAIYDVGCGRDRTTCRLAGYEEGYDLALLGAQRDGLEKFPSFSISGDAQTGDTIWSCGYPFGIEVPVVRRGTVAAVVMPDELTVVDRSMFISRQTSFPAYWLDVPIFEGNSGGPVINAQGALIGLALRTITFGGRHTEAPSMGAADCGQPVYMDLGIALRLNLALAALGLGKLL